MIMTSTLWPSPTHSLTSKQRVSWWYCCHPTSSFAYTVNSQCLAQKFLLSRQQDLGESNVAALTQVHTHTRVWEWEAGTAEVHVPWTTVVFHKGWELVFQTKFIRNSIIRPAVRGAICSISLNSGGPRSSGISSVCVQELVLRWAQPSTCSRRSTLVRHPTLRSRNVSSRHLHASTS